MKNPQLARVTLVRTAAEVIETPWTPVPELARAIEAVERWIGVRALGDVRALAWKRSLEAAREAGRDPSPTLEAIREALSARQDRIDDSGASVPGEKAAALARLLSTGLAAQQAALASAVVCGACGARLPATRTDRLCPHCGAPRTA